MNVSKLTAAVLAVLVVSTGVGAVAATPGNGNAPDDAGTDAANAPSDAADANTTDARDEGMSREEVADSAANDSEAMTDPANASEGETPRSEEAAGAAAAEERRGPPADLPEQVPDHVSEIHQRIVSFLDGELDSLGAAVSGVTPDGEDETAADGDAQAAENADSEADDEATTTEEPTTEEPETEEPETEEPETEEDGDSTETVTATPTTEA